MAIHSLQQAYNQFGLPVLSKLGLDGAPRYGYWLQTAVETDLPVSQVRPSPFWHLPTIRGEMDAFDTILSEIDSGTVFYDIGAHFGQFSIPAALCGADCVSFEPFPGNAEQLRQFCSAAGVSPTFRDIVITDSDGPVSFGGVDGGTEARIAPEGDEMEGRRLDSLDLPSPDVVKIDVEGAELRVIEGGRETLSQADCVVCEVHRLELGLETAVDDVRSALEGLGFETEVLSERLAETFVVARY